jgi:hypothetical protein
VLAQPPQHLEVAAARRGVARPLVPRAVVVAQPLQHLEVAALFSPLRTQEILVIQKTTRVPVLQQADVSEFRGFYVRQTLDLAPRRVHGVAHAFAHRAEPTEVPGFGQKVRSENVR